MPTMLAVTNLDTDYTYNVPALEFDRDNDEEFSDDIYALEVDESFEIGGGAAPAFRITRVA